MATLVTDSERRSPARLAGSAVLACQRDDRLVALVHSGHERAFEAIVDRYRRPLLRFCRGILPESRAEDAVQQTFINAHTALLDSDDSVQLKPWLYTIARNVSLNMLRQNGWNYDQIPLDFDGVRRPDQVIEQRIELQETVAAVNELPERQRSAIVMRELEGRSYQEIAVALGANDGAVRQLLNRARGTLRSAASAIMPTPLVTRLIASSDGRRVAEIAGGLGAAGIAKVGVTALVAGTLVVGAVEAPITGHHGKSSGTKAAQSSHRGGTSKAAFTATPAAVTTGSRGNATITTGDGHGRSGRSGSSGDHSGSGKSGSNGSGDGHSGSFGSGDTSHSGSGRSGSDDGSRSGSSSPSSGSDDGAGSKSGSGTSGGSDDSIASSGDSTSSGSGGGSDDFTSTSGSGTSGSGSSSSGSGELESGSSTSGSDSGTSGSGSSGSDDSLDPTRVTDGH